MKRLIALGLALAMFTTLGCAKSATPEERFEAVMLKSAASTSMECDTQAKVKVEIEGTALDMDMSMGVKMNHTSEKLEMSMKNIISFMGQTMEGESYYKDGFLYSSMMGQKLKMSLGVEQMVEQLKTQNMQSLPVSDMSQFDMKKVDKDFEFTYTVKPEMLASYVEQAEAMLQGGLADSGEIKINSMSGTLLADADNNIKRQTMQMTMQMDIAGQSANMTMDMTFEYKNIGGAVVIEFPTDLDSYQAIG